MNAVDPNPSAQHRKALAERIGLTEEQVAVRSGGHLQQQEDISSSSSSSSDIAAQHIRTTAALWHQQRCFAKSCTSWLYQVANAENDVCCQMTEHPCVVNCRAVLVQWEALPGQEKARCCRDRATAASSTRQDGSCNGSSHGTSSSSSDSHSHS